ncbi:MAG: DUF169 domain-containing protein [bacterium]|nr:MAG: DUF169 domain-containing protein [bacterium]
MRERIKKFASIHWIGIKFSEEEKESTLDEQISFCDALSMSIVNSPLVLTSTNLNSRNMHYLLGWEDGLNLNDIEFSKENIDKNIANKIISDIKPLKKKIQSIIVNGYEADVFTGFIQPEAVTPIFKEWYYKTGKLPLYRLSPISLDCISCIVECFNENYPVFSFGCEESRKHGNISRDRLLIAIPNDRKFFID